MSEYRAGFIGLIGQPNAGKSSLLNFLVDEKVSIVSAKPQTTRRRVQGILNTPQAQIVFVDSPGFVKADKGLNGFLAAEAESIIRESDALMLVLSIDEESVENIEKIIQLAVDSKKPWCAVITKVDLLEMQRRVSILQQKITDAGGKAFVASVKDQSAKNHIKSELLSHLPSLLPVASAPLFDDELYTTENIRDLVSEIVRESCFELLHQEIPYSLAVRIMQFDELAEPIPKIVCELIVSKENHKKMVLGKGGATIKSIGMKARPEIEKLLGEKVFLGLQVTVKENWHNNQQMMKELRYHNVQR